ncbi:MAG: D-alanine--D-alanine ligase [Pelagibacterales bacterium]|nr:D-alanine--D-alanine ligase [Pelagibacterales bacterium]
MIIEDVKKENNLITSKNHYLQKNNVLSIKINKKIEIIIVPKPINLNEHQKNVGIKLDENLILKIISRRYLHVLITVINSEKDLEDMALRKPDLVFSGVKYFNFNSKIIWLNDYLDLLGIPYIASNRAALDNESNKILAKKIIKKNQIKTADFFIAEPGEYLNKLSIPIDFPLFVKPVSGGDSIGINSKSIVHDFAAFEKKVLDIKLKQNTCALVETYLSGKEYSVGIFEDSNNHNLKAMPIEISVKANSEGYQILDFNVKKNDTEIVLPVKDSKIFNDLSKLAKDAFTALGGKSLGRIDIKMDHLGVPHFIEANLMPGLQQGYFYRSCVLNLNMNYDDMILSITNTGLTSH